MISQIDIEDYIKEQNEKEMTTIQTDSTTLKSLMTRSPLCHAVDILVGECYGRALRNGWHTNLETGEPILRPVPELLCLIHSEISEALEGYRKNLLDDHLPNRMMLAVELGDAVIRICDMAGAYGIPLGDVIQEKLDYNDSRADHKPENRKKADGKKI